VLAVVIASQHFPAIVLGTLILASSVFVFALFLTVVATIAADAIMVLAVTA